MTLVYSLQSQLSKDRRELSALRDQIESSQLARQEPPTGSSECSDADRDTASTSELPSVGSAGHSAGTCKPCAFLHSKGCTSGQGCQFCHLCGEGEKERRKQMRKTLPRSRFPVATTPHSKVETSEESTSVTASLQSASGTSISSTCVGASPHCATERCESTSPAVDQTVGSTPREKLPRAETRMSWSDMFSEDESDADAPEADEDVKSSVSSSLPPWRRKSSDDPVQRTAVQKLEVVAARMTLSDIKACLSGAWLGSHGECYEIDFNNWTCTRYSPAGSSAGSRKFTLCWKQKDDAIRWGSNFVLHLTGLKPNPEKVSWQSISDQRSFQWKRKL
eukprot:TRINITY_DN11089_c0_g1_i2.p1 TRINITY_DN11089_c0_g1~~TRINITY_DN11089_c0_g1_i2.p1  ORF type:complete len:335 (-),score=54.53 TRINITY_DN11089_c0_g1_i2:189-1193(-)